MLAMGKFKNKYLNKNSNLKILDIGSYDSSNTNYNYGYYLKENNWVYHGMDIQNGPNVDILVEDIYNWVEIKDNSYDVVVSGQAFEHMEFFWKAIQEVERILKPGGLCCIIVPSSGPVHRNPYDCFRFKDDGLKAIAEYVNLDVLECYTNNEDISSPWYDSVLIAKKKVEKTSSGLNEFKDLENDYDDALRIKKKTDQVRSKLYSYDKKLLNPTNIKLNFKNFYNAPDGRFDIIYKNINFECLFKRKNDSETLYVFLNGARPAGDSKPLFARWSYYKYLNGSILNIDDPMCKINKELKIGWYYGNNDESYCDYIVDIVQEFAQQNCMNNIIFFGSSGGGYAALYCACKLKGSTVVAINPQIKLKLYYHYAKTFEKLTGLDLEINDKFNRNNLPLLIKNAHETKFIIIENAESELDMVFLNDLTQTLGCNYSYGITRLSPNIISWVYQANYNDTPHTTQEFPEMVFAIEYLINNFEIAEKLNYIYLIFNELWYSHYRSTKSD